MCHERRRQDDSRARWPDLIVCTRYADGNAVGFRETVRLAPAKDPVSGHPL